MEIWSEGQRLWVLKSNHKGITPLSFPPRTPHVYTASVQSPFYISKISPCQWYERSDLQIVFQRLLFTGYFSLDQLQQMPIFTKAETSLPILM